MAQYTEREALNKLIYTAYTYIENADETTEQQIVLDAETAKMLTVYARATTATTFHLDISPDGNKWFEDFAVFSSTTTVNQTMSIGVKYIRLRSESAGTAGTDTVTLFLAAK